MFCLSVSIFWNIQWFGWKTNSVLNFTETITTFSSFKKSHVLFLPRFSFTANRSDAHYFNFIYMETLVEFIIATKVDFIFFYYLDVSLDMHAFWSLIISIQFRNKCVWTKKKTIPFCVWKCKNFFKKRLRYFSSFYPNDSLVHSVILLWKHTDAFDMARFR